MHTICGYAPYTKLHLFCNGERVIERVFRHEEQRITNGEKPFDRKFTVDQGNDDGVLPCIKGTIYYHHITLTNSGSFHGVASYPDIKRGLRMGNHQFIHIQFRLAVVISRGGKATRNMPGNKRRRRLTHTFIPQTKIEKCQTRPTA